MEIVLLQMMGLGVLIGGALMFAALRTAPRAPKGGGGELPSAPAVHALIKARRSVFPKDFSGGAVPRAALERCLASANWAPTHGKTEPWRFVVFTGLEGVERFISMKRSAIAKHFAGGDAAARDAALGKAARKEMELRACAHIVVLGIKRVANGKGNLMPRWEEEAATACAVQNFHLALCAEGYAGYWSSGGVGSWLDVPDVRRALELDGEVDGEPDAVVGAFFVGTVAPSKLAGYRSKRGDVMEKTQYIE